MKKLAGMIMLLLALGGIGATGVLPQTVWAETVTEGSTEENTENTEDTENKDETEDKDDTDTEPEEKTVRILLVGNSFTRHELKDKTLSVEEPLREMAEAAGHKLEVVTLAHNSAKLNYYAGMSTQYLMYHWELLGNLLNEKWDYIVLQEQSTEPILNFQTSTYPAVEALQKIVKAYQPDAKLLTYMTPGYSKFETATLSKKMPHISKKEMQQYIAAAYYTLEQHLGVETVPIGMQYARCNSLYPWITLEGSDNMHPLYAGYYLAAGNFYQRIYGEAPLTLGEKLTNCDIEDVELEQIAGLYGNSLVLLPKEMTLYAGDVKQLAAFTGESAEPAVNVTYISLDETVAKIDKVTGALTGIGEGSTAVMAVAENGMQAFCNVHVELPLSFASSWYVAGIGDKLNIQPRAAKNSVKWSSASTKRASVASTGVVTAKTAGAVKITVTNKEDTHDKASYTLYVRCQAPTGLKISAFSKLDAGASAGKLKVSWKAVSGATRYRIYRSYSKDGSYEFVGESPTNSWTDTWVPLAQQCYYKVVAGNQYEQCMSELSESSVRGIVLKTKPFSGKRLKNKTIKLSWKKSPNASGYLLYRSTKKNSGYKKIATLTSNKKVSYTDKNVSKKKTYYYRIKAYRKLDGVTFYGLKSKTVTVKK